MRITFPNPFGPPITLDTGNASALGSRLAGSKRMRLPGQLGGARRPQTRALVLLVLLVLLVTWYPTPPFPPAYREEWKMERRAKTDRGGWAEGKDGRYVKFDIPQGTGFNHQLQRVLLQHHLAHLGNRSLAYEPVIRERTWLPFKLTSFPWHSARIPLSAFTANPISGFERHYKTPRAVPSDHYSSVCRWKSQRKHVLKTKARPDGDLELVADGQARITQLQVMLAGADDSCFRIEGELFDDDFFDSSAPLELYESYSKSPVLKHFTFSPLVMTILNRVLPELAPEAWAYDIDRIRTAPADPYKTSTWKHVLALHLRRGDEWEKVCTEKGMRAAPFVGFNKLPLLPGNENVPPPASMPEATRMGLYRAKCLPETLEIIARARRMRKNHPLLRSVYLLTDADEKWTREIVMWLQSEGWDRVWVGRTDVYPDWDSREVGVAVDMEVARRAGVFVGNGFSTTSSNIVLLRSRDGIHPDLTQFW